MPTSEALARHARMQGDRCAVSVDGQCVSYETLWRDARRIYAMVAGLPRVGRPQSALAQVPVFGLMLGNHPMAPAFLAAAFGTPCCVVLLDPTWPGERVATVLKRLPVDVLFTARTPAPEVIATGTRIVDLSEAGVLDAMLPAAPLDDDVRTRPDQPFLVAFTSGTTSHPKAFVRLRKTWRTSLDLGQEVFALDRQMDTMAPGPLAHGLTLYALLETLDAGATFHAMGRFNAAETWRHMTQEQVARLVCVPSMLDALSRHAQGEHGLLDTLRQITVAGARLEPSLLGQIRRLAPSADVTEYYGASELGFVATATHPVQPGQQVTTVSGVGRPFPGVEIDIRRPDKSAPSQADGMVYVRSPLTIDDYLWRDDDAGFRSDGDWATVGDLGHVDADGNLHLAGRADGMVITGGYNVYPEEIAACLMTLEGIAGVCVVGVPDRYLGQKLVAVIERTGSGLVLDAAALAAHCAQTLPRYKIPRAFFAIEEWPMTSSGKIARARVLDHVVKEDSSLVLL